MAALLTEPTSLQQVRARHSRRSCAWISALCGFAIQLLGGQAAISSWQQFDYLFSPGGNVGGRLQRSDTGAIADAVLLPYWVWGATIGAAILALLWVELQARFPTLKQRGEFGGGRACRARAAIRAACTGRPAGP